MWITSLCLLLSVGYRGQHDLNTQVANTQLFGWVFGTWVFTTLGIVEVGYSVLLPLYAGIGECWLLEVYIVYAGIRECLGLYSCKTECWGLYAGTRECWVYMLELESAGVLERGERKILYFHTGKCWD